MTAYSAAADAGRSASVDWDGDGKIDILMNSAPNVNFFRALGRDEQGRWKFKDEGPGQHARARRPRDEADRRRLEQGRRPELLIGAEDGFFYQVKNPRAK